MKKELLIILTFFLFLNLSFQQLPKLAETPPMGWNSWDCFGMDVSDEQLKGTADYMAKYLKKYGWEYVVLDMGWYFGEGTNTTNFTMKYPDLLIDEYGRLVPSLRKFPSSANGKGLKPIADYVHSKGLKFGIHMVRGIPRQAVEMNTPIKGTYFRAKDIATETKLSSWYHGMFSIDMSKPGAQEYYNSLIEVYAEWGVDYIKADDILNPYHKEEIEGIRKAIDKTGRPVVLSLSAGPVPVERVDHLQQNAHMWRITNDMWDDWSFFEKTIQYCRIWQNHIMPNHWPDCDMLPLGKLRINSAVRMFTLAVNLPPEKTINEYSRLSKDEQYTVFTLWSIFRSPLMMGGNLMENDKFTHMLMTNKEVIHINQHSTNTRELRYSDSESVWVAEDPDTGARYVALFNLGNEVPAKMKIDWSELGISGKYKVRDVWSRKNIGIFENGFEALVQPHGCGFYKIYQ